MQKVPNKFYKLMIVLLSSVFFLSSCSFPKAPSPAVSGTVSPYTSSIHIGEGTDKALDNSMIPTDRDGYGPLRERKTYARQSSEVLETFDSETSVPVETTQALSPLGFPIKDEEEKKGNQILERNDVLGGTLRLPILKPSFYHPLLPRSLNDEALNRLLFRSLFTFDEDMKIVPDLATNLDFSEDGRLVEVSIKQGAAFADGRQIEATDLVQIFNAFLGLDTNDIAQKIYKESPWVKRLGAIESVEALEANSIRIHLKKQDPWIAYALTFPVIAEQDVPKLGIWNFTSNGDFLMGENIEILDSQFGEKSEDGFILRRKLLPEQHYRFEAIQLLAFPNSEQAREAFLEGRLDLYYGIPGESASLSKYKHYVFPSLDAVALRFRKPDSDEIRKELKLLREYLFPFYGDENLFRAVDPALSQNSYPFPRASLKEAILQPWSVMKKRRPPGVNPEKLKKTSWVLLARKGDPFAREISETLKFYFEDIGLTLNLNFMEDASLSQALKSDSWDFYLDYYQQSTIPDPGVFIPESGDYFWRKDNNFPDSEYASLDPDLMAPIVQRWKKSRIPKGAFSLMTDPDFRREYADFFGSQGMMPLCNANVALYQSQYLSGSLYPNYLDPIAGLKEVFFLQPAKQS